MNLLRRGAWGAIFCGGLIAGCQESPTEKVEKAQEAVVEAKQDLLEKQAKLQDVKDEAGRPDGSTDAGGPILTLPPAASEPGADSAPLSEGSESVTAPAESADTNPGTAEAPADAGSTEPPDQPNEGDPQAGTQDGTAGEGSGSEDQGGESADPESGAPQ